MKIAVASSGPDLDASINPRFGRCPYFALIFSESGASETLTNPLIDAAGGACTQGAQWILDHDVHALLTGRCGPKAIMVLEDAEIRIVEGAPGKVRDAAGLVERSVFSAAAAPAEPGRRPGGGPGTGDGRKGRGGGMRGDSGRGMGGGRNFGGGCGHGA
jgi:predicted Fe-Mo cluster-binding NifX family protein